MSPLPFRAFQKDVPVHTTRSKLPHWSQEMAVHFVTFRQADSIPRNAMENWDSKRAEWLSRRNLSIHQPGWLGKLSTADRREYRRLFGQAFERLLDNGTGSCLLREPMNRDIVETSMRFFDGRKYYLGDFVIMPNHVHVLLIPIGSNPIQKTLKSWKSFTAREVNMREGRSGQFWQSESFDHIVRSRGQLDHLRDYIAENPVKAGLAIEEFTHFSAEWQP